MNQSKKAVKVKIPRLVPFTRDFNRLLSTEEDAALLSTFRMSNHAMPQHVLEAFYAEACRRIEERMPSPSEVMRELELIARLHVPRDRWFDFEGRLGRADPLGEAQ